MRRRKRRRLRSAEPEFHHNVYVVLLSKAALKDRSILQGNPERDPGKPAVYVGMTGLPVDHRFENHKNGYKSARLVRKYGVRLLPEMYEHLNPMPYEHAAQMEKDLADDLRVQGYAVVGGPLREARVWSGSQQGSVAHPVEAGELGARSTEVRNSLRRVTRDSFVSATAKSYQRAIANRSAVVDI